MSTYIRWAMTTLVLALATIAVAPPRPLEAAGAAVIDQEVDAALVALYANTPRAQELGERAKGVLVFPNIVKAGFLVGAQYGDGALRVQGRTVGYYNTVAASYGFQAGVQAFSDALFFMTDGALRYLQESEGWELGTGPSIVVLDEGMAQSLSTTTLRDDVYAFIFHQEGLMAGVGLQGSKITKIHPAQ